MLSKEKVKKISRKSSNQKYICQHGKYIYNCKNIIAVNEENSNPNFKIGEAPEKVLTFGNKNSAFQRYTKSTHCQICKQKSAFQLWRKLI
jgi:hypothetical protein